MGCGATICGAPVQSPTIAIVSLKSASLLRILEPKIKPNNYMLSKKQVEKFVQKMEMNGQMYNIKLQRSIQKGGRVPLAIMQKWRVILYGLDTDFQQYVNCVGYTELENRKDIENEDQNVGLPKELPHPSFQQIQKDLDRTFQLPQLKRETFSKILKCIACRFPKMGYTQGINFIVGYFLIIGYSQSDTFWLFCHMALNRRYMLLGLFQDGFPLSKVYLTIFKNILKRLLPVLHTHLYQSLVVNDSLWIFKWLVTYYLYSFPIQMCKYVWDIVILLGGIGLVYFAIGITTCLQSIFMNMNDQCEVSQFLAQLKELDGFNQYVKIQEVLRIAYGISIQIVDLEGIQISNGGVYSNYLVSYWTSEINKRNDRNQDKHLNNPENTISTILASSHENMLNIPHPSGNPPLKVMELQSKQSRNTYQQRAGKLSLQIQQDAGKGLLIEWYESLSNERHEFQRMRGLNHHKSNRISIGGQDRLLGKMEQSAMKIDTKEQIVQRKDKRQVQNNNHNLILTSNQKIEQFLMQSKEGESKFYKQKQKAETTTIHLSSHPNIDKWHFVPSKINQIWDEQQDMANESPDKITDMETKRQISSIQNVKIDLGQYFHDNHQLQNEYKDGDWYEKVSEGGIRKRSGSKIGEKGIEHKIGYGQNQSVNSSLIQNVGNRLDGSSKNKVKTQEGKQITDKDNINQSQSVISVPLPLLVSIPYKPTLMAFGRTLPIDYEGITSNNQGFDTSSQNNSKNSRLAMAGKNIMSSLSVSNASISGKSSSSSQHNYNNSRNSHHQNQRQETDERKWKKNAVNININVNVNVNVNNNVFGKSINSGSSCEYNYDRDYGDSLTDYQQGNKKYQQNKKHNVNQKYSKQQYNIRRQDRISQDKYYIDLQSPENLRQKSSNQNDNYKAGIQQLMNKNDNLLINSLSEISIEKKKIRNYQGQWIDSVYKVQDIPKMIHTESKHSMRSEVEIYDGGQLFKKKNRIVGRIGSGFDIGNQGLDGYVDESNLHDHFDQKNSTYYPTKYDKNNVMIVKVIQQKDQYPGTSTDKNMDQQFSESNMNKLDQQQSCESILLAEQSEEGHKSSSRSVSRSISRNNKKDLEFEIESAK